jgi:hypothetical protein
VEPALRRGSRFFFTVPQVTGDQVREVTSRAAEAHTYSDSSSRAVTA